MMHYKQVIKNALSKGYTISVWDGEEWQVKRSSNDREILNAAQSVDMATLRIRNADQVVGSVVVFGYTSAAALDGDDDSVVDYTDNPETSALVEDVA